MPRTALIVDDSATVRQMIKATMNSMGFESLTAQDGEKALKILGDRAVNIIITAINMPNMDGIELIRELRKTKNAGFTPILVILLKVMIIQKMLARQQVLQGG